MKFQAFFYAEHIVSYPYENWQHPVEERDNGALERV